ncbi:MAG: hypothetical protein ABIG67_11155 [Pseudomonadota bacterium]
MKGISQNHTYLMRVESCIGTIIDVHKSIRHHRGNLEFLSQFQKLKEALHDMDMTKVSEQDVLMVEQATNALLGEFKSMFESGDYGSVYNEIKH